MAADKNAKYAQVIHAFGKAFFFLAGGGECYSSGKLPLQKFLKILVDILENVFLFFFTKENWSALKSSSNWRKIKLLEI